MFPQKRIWRFQTSQVHYSPIVQHAISPGMSTLVGNNGMWLIHYKKKTWNKYDTYALLDESGRQICRVHVH